MVENSNRMPASTFRLGVALQVAWPKTSPRFSVTSTLAAGKGTGTPLTA